MLRNELFWFHRKGTVIVKVTSKEKIEEPKVKEMFQIVVIMNIFEFLKIIYAMLVNQVFAEMISFYEEDKTR